MLYIDGIILGGNNMKMIFLVCLSFMNLGLYSQKEKEYIYYTDDLYGINTHVIDSIKKEEKVTNNSRILIYQPAKIYGLGCILFINDNDITKFWYFSENNKVYIDKLSNDSIFKFKDYLNTGVLKIEELKEDSPNVSPICINGEWQFLTALLTDVNLIYYEDNYVRFYFENEEIIQTYDPMPEKSKPREQWRDIIRKEFDLILKKYKE